MKLKRIRNVKNIGLALVVLIGPMLLDAEAIAADPVQDAATTQEATVSNQATPHPAAQDIGNKENVDTTATDSAANKHKVSQYYAKVGNIYVTWADFETEYNNQAKKKFYHGQPSDSMVATFQRQIGETLVTNAMLVLEAKHRKLKPDDVFVKQQLDLLERRLAKDPKWPEARPRVLPIITARLQNESLRVQLEKLVRNAPPPSEKQLREYYAAHPEKFTVPSRQRVALILLRVDPGAPDADWQKAGEEGRDLVKRLRAGEDFAVLARQYSADKTADNGGDMGYLHEGMMTGVSAETVSKLQSGETSDPVTLMEGVAIFRLIDRTQPEIRSFKAVKARAKGLWLSEQGDNAWSSLIARLKKNTPVEVDESLFVPLPAASEKTDESLNKTKP